MSLCGHYQCYQSFAGESTASPAIHTFESAITDGALPSISSLDFDQSKESEHLLGNTETSKFQLPIQSNFKPILLPPKSPMRLFLPTMMQLDPGVLQLWPPPRTILQYKGTSYVPPLQIVFMLMSTRNVESSKYHFSGKSLQFFFKWVMLGKGHGGLYNASTKEEIRKRKAKRREGSDQVY